MRKIKKQMVTFLIVLVLGVSIILTACKKTTSYTYSFNVDGGVSIGDVSIEEGSDYTLPTTAEKEGYVFEGWYDNPEFNGEAVTSVKASSNLTFYAKWSKLYVATLDVNGGVLSTTSVSVKVGANLKDALKDLNPTKSGVIFAGWFKDGKALASSDVMPAQDISLVAKYKQTYRVEYYQQKMDGSGYDKTEETGSALLGETFTPAKKEFAGFKEVTKSETVDSVVIDEDASKNVIKKYFDRNQCTITLDSNYPTDKENVVTTKDYIAGSKIELTNDLSCEGYLLVGWSDAKDGEVLYQVNPISSVFNDAEGSGLPASTEALVATETKTLYAVWKKGYTDMFGGKDSIYLFEDKIFLNRYDLFFKGEYNANDQSFSFFDSKDEVILNGKFITDSTFAYYSELRTNGAYTLVDLSGLNSNVMLYFLDGYNGCEYSVKDEAGKTSVSTGTYVAADENEYVITFAEGPLAGQKLHFFIGVLNNTAVFKVRNDAELELSGLGLYSLKDGVPTLDESIKSNFDGYGSCTFGTTEFLCSYDSEKGVLTLYSTSGELAGYLKVVEYESKKGLADYVAELDHTYQSGADTLTLDGVFTATYKTGSEEVKGTYSFTNSFLSYAIIDLVTEEKESYKFTLVHDTKVNEANPEESTVDYLFNKVEKEYGEYLYLDIEGLYYAPLIVPENATQASLYGYTETREYVKVSSGTYSLDETSGRYTYTVTETFDGSAAMVDPFDLTKIQSIVYEVDVVESYAVNYWIEYKNVEGTTTSLVKEYTGETVIQGQTVKLVLSLVADKASIKASDFDVELLSGIYSQTGTNVLTIELADDQGTMVVELDEEKKTFTEIYETYTMYEYKNNEVNQNAYFFLDKTGKIFYVEETPAVGETPASKTEIEGTLAETDETTTPGSPIYLFTSKDETVSFKLIMLANNTAEYFARYDEALDVTYNGVEGSAGGMLVLDGYGFLAMAYVDGETITGFYTVDIENKLITFTDENEDLYFFDIDPVAKTYTLRGYEYGSYFLLNNQAIDYFVKLDGYGKAELYTIEGENEVLVDGKATYSFNEEDYFILTYTADSKQITATCVLTTYILSGDEYPAIAVSHKEVVSKYVNEADWSILLVDEFGLATLYDPEGLVKEGSCSILSTNLLYFVTDDGSYAGIYQFDIETGALSQANLKLKSYYTYDFESLIFTDYGLVIDNGSANAYYNVENGKIIVYAYEPKSEKANEYGYVQKEYGQYGDEQITANEKKYYINTGYAIEFNRADTDKLADNSYKYPFVNSKDEKLPIEALYFSPTGKEFNVSGQIKIGGQTYACTIVREKLADNTYNAYVVVQDQYYITINLVYAGIDDAEESLSTFTVTSFKSVLDIPAFDYVYISWYLSQMLGQDAYGMIENTYGSVTINWEYDETGAEKISYANSTFADTAALKDSLGNEINLNESEYEIFIDNNSTIYVNASVVAKDGYTYNLYLQTQVLEDYNHLGIAVMAMTRTQKFTVGEYNLEVEQIVYFDGTSDTTQSNSLGEVYDIKITQNETAIPVELVLTDDYGHTFAVSRTYDETTQKITSTVYYLLEYTLVAAEAESTYTPLYDTFTITETAVTTYYTADGKSYVDILADGSLEMISIDGEFVPYSKPTYDETTKTYTYDVEGESSYKTYSIVITDGVATITFVKETPKTEVGTGQ